MKFLAKKSLGQHFLNSPHVLEQIIQAGNIRNNEKVLEIGPGTGVLTRALLKTSGNIIAIEKDDRAYSFLKEKFSQEISSERLRLIHGDILEIDCSELGLNNGNYALIANIPYYITGAILQKFLEGEPRPNRMVLLVQKEVAMRIVARDGKESILSVSVKAFGTPKMVANVPRGAFTPAPSVDSAILLIENISASLFSDKNIGIKPFFDIIHAGFSHKRKILIRNLETLIGHQKLEKIWDDMNLNNKIRAEDLALKHWFDIASKI